MKRLEGYKSLQWPVAPDGTDQPLLYTKEFFFLMAKRGYFLLAGWNHRSNPMTNLIFT